MMRSVQRSGRVVLVSWLLAAGWLLPFSASAQQSEEGVTAQGHGESIDESEVNALIEQWLAAQNTGDFSSYETLYATRFFGVKRAGPVTRQYDRAGWLADRRRMFRRAMTVTAEDISMTRSAVMVVVEFTQTWESGSYRDVGPKELVLVREAGDLRITREEMVASTIEGATTDGAAYAPASHGLVLTEGGERYVVLDVDPEEGWMMSDALESVARGHSVRAPLRAEELPPELLSWVGREARLFDETGVSCAARVDALWGMVNITAHFGSEQEWDGEYADEPWSDEAVARDVWRLGEPLIVGHLETSADSECSGWWLRAADLPEPVVFPPVGLDGDLEEQALRAFRELPAYRTIQAYYEEEVGEESPWYFFEGSRPVVRAFGDPATGRLFVSVAANAGIGCGDFYGGFFALYEVSRDEGEARFVLLSDPEEPTWGRTPRDVFTPRTVVDTDGDGRPEFSDGARYFRTAGAVQRQVLDVNPEFLDCAC